MRPRWRIAAYRGNQGPGGTGIGGCDHVVLPGELTGSETKAEDVEVVRAHTSLPLLIGSGATP